MSLYRTYKQAGITIKCRSQWPSVPGRPLPLGLRVQIQQGTGMSVSCEDCVFSRTGLLVGLITRPDGSYRVAVAPWGEKLLENDNYDIIFYNSEQIYILRGAQCAGCI